MVHGDVRGRILPEVSSSLSRYTSVAPADDTRMVPGAEQGAITEA
jgi:hypothetical protein